MAPAPGLRQSLESMFQPISALMSGPMFFTTSSPKLPPGVRKMRLASVPVTASMAARPFSTSAFCSSGVMKPRFTPWPLPAAWS